MGYNEAIVHKQKLFQRIVNNPRNVRFETLKLLATAFGFTLVRVQGSHHIFLHPLIDEIINLQDVGGMAKPYQVRQLLGLIERYNLSLEGEAH